MMVYRVKQALRHLGYSLKDDRLYSPMVSKKVKKFQEEYGLPATGQVDMRTWNRLRAVARMEGYKETRTEQQSSMSRSIAVDDLSLVKQGMVNSEVQFLQSMLIEADIYLVPDGHFGPGTTRALRDYQELRNLDVDGIAGPQTWRQLAKDFTDEFQELGVKYIITEKNFSEVAAELGCDIATVKAVYEVESRGVGFLEDGRPVILFEGHVFWRELKKRGIDPQQFVAENQDILYPHWNSAYYSGRKKQYVRLEKAMAIHEEAALCSASWGLFQIMGYHGPDIGYSSVQAFVDAQYESARNHLEAFMGFVKANNLSSYLIERDWAGFARRYNGPGYGKNKYDVKLAEAYSRLLDC